MIFPDVNLLIYAYNRDSDHHRQCSAWFTGVMNGDEKVAFSWHTLLGFVRITTASGLLPRPFSTDEAMEIAAELLESPNSVMIEPTDKHFAVIRKLAADAGIRGGRLSDAHLAALAIEHGATLASADRDFQIFDRLKLLNPLSN